MTVTLNIPPDLETLLQEKATQQGQELPDYLLALAEADLYASDWQTDQDREEEIAIVQERMADRIAGEKGILLEDYRAQVLAKREPRKQEETVGAAT
jgi:hypothetical protein